MYCCKCAAKCEISVVNGQSRETCPACGHIYYKNPLPCVSVLVADGKRIALGKRSKMAIHPDKWCLPCGYIEYEENYHDASVREVREEIGIDTIPQKIINVVTNQLSQKIKSIVIVILSKPVNLELVAGDDIVEARWFDISEVLPELAFDADAYIISKYKKHIDNDAEMPGILFTETLSSVCQCAL